MNHPALICPKCFHESKFHAYSTYKGIKKERYICTNEMCGKTYSLNENNKFLNLKEAKDLMITERYKLREESRKIKAKFELTREKLNFINEKLKKLIPQEINWD